MGRRNVAEGAEKPIESGDHVSTVRGGMVHDYFWAGPSIRASGYGTHDWHRELDDC